MANEMHNSLSRLSPEIWSAAKTRLPLRLPQPAETGVRYESQTGGAMRVARREPARIRLHQPLPAAPLSDVELEAMAQRALLQSGVWGFTKLHVEVRDAIATLYGRLPTDIERQVAMQLVRRVNGIVRVEHEISVEEFAAASAVPSKPAWQRLPLSAVGLAIAAAALLTAFLIRG